jgi:tartrate dehydrogenase/decarboxylase/D-malate dehydrogenase
MSEKIHRIAVIAGDGIGKEVVPAAQSVIDAIGRAFGFRCEWSDFDWSCEVYADTGSMTGGASIEALAEFNAVFLGAVGYPGVPDHVSLWGLLIPIRRRFEQYVNLRPVRLLPGVRTPLADRKPNDIDFVIVRENNEGEYSEIGGRLYEGTSRELVVQQSVFTRVGVDRILRYAFELARSRPKKHLTSATKSNGIIHSMPYWDERFGRRGQVLLRPAARQFESVA